MKIVAIIQARMGSTRLPGKVLKDLHGKTVLSHVLERVKQSKYIDQIIVATTTLLEDDVIQHEATKCGVTVFRGSSEDVLSRYYEAAKENLADVVVRITSDCPLIDATVIDEMIGFYLRHSYDLVTNAGADLEKRTYPRGLDTEIFSFAALENALHEGKKGYHREHVTPYIYEKSDDVYYYTNQSDYSFHRWTLDTIEDYVLIDQLYEKLYKGRHLFYLEEILEVFELHPELIEINAHIEQKKAH